MPAAKKSDWGRATIAGVLMVAALALCMALAQPPFLRALIEDDAQNWFPADFEGSVLALVAMPVLVVLSIVIHELGHLGAGLSVGFQFQSLQIGRYVWGRTLKVTRSAEKPGYFAGVVMFPADTAALPLRASVFYAGGSLANLLTCALVLLSPWRNTPLSTVLIAASLLFGVGELLPYRNELVTSDGLKLWTLFRKPAAGIRWVALMRLESDRLNGVMPEALSPEFIALATAFCDETPETVEAFGHAYLTAFHQHRDDEAASALECCLRFSRAATPLLRHAYIGEAAVFQARRRSRPDLAAQWLEQLPQQPALLWWRTCAEVAILEAKGEYVAALAKLEVVEAVYRSFLTQRLQGLVVPLVQRWEAELKSLMEQTAAE